MGRLRRRSRDTERVTDLPHTHLTVGLELPDTCPACDQHRADLAAARQRRPLAGVGQSRK
jgi:hypothetical protein